MKLYVQLMIIFTMSLIGEGISTLVHLPIPGSIIGLLILFLCLQLKWLRIRHVTLVGSFLLANMTILFLPAGVGIMAKWNLISHFWAQILLIVVGALIINMLILGKLVEWIKVKFEGDYVALKPETTVTSSTEDQ